MICEQEESQCTEYLISSPLRVPTSKRKDFILNMNQALSSHFRVYSKAKRVYTNLMKHLVVTTLPVFKAVEVTFTLYPKTKRRTDLDGVCSIHSKFFLDTLVYSGRIEDDDYWHVKGIHFAFGFVCPENPRVDITIKSIQ
jgi:hypothetical protein